MNGIPRAAILLIATAWGCAHTRQVRPDSASMARLDARVRHRPAELVLRDGGRYATQEIRLTPDSAFWQVPGVSGRRAASMSNVSEISYKSRLRGALDGLILGFLIGASLGVGLIDNPEGSSNGVVNRAETGLAGGVPFAIWGAPIGAIIGSRLRFRIKAP